MANQVVVQQVQSLAGNHVLVPAPELQILSTFWDINGNLSLVIGVTLNVTTVGPPGSTATKLYQIFIQVSCLDSAGKEFTCATGNGTINLPVNMNGKFVLLTIPITPQVDPETIEIHDLSFIVTGSPSTPPPPPAQCDSTFTVSATPPNVNLTRPAVGNSSATVTKTLFYPKNANPCPKILVNLVAKSNPPGLLVFLSANSVILTPGGTAVVSETIVATPNTLPGQYTVIETDTSPPAIVSVVTQVFVV